MRRMSYYEVSLFSLCLLLLRFNTTFTSVDRNSLVSHAPLANTLTISLLHPSITSAPKARKKRAEIYCTNFRGTQQTDRNGYERLCLPSLTSNSHTQRRFLIRE